MQVYSRRCRLAVYSEARVRGLPDDNSRISHTRLDAVRDEAPATTGSHEAFLLSEERQPPTTRNCTASVASSRCRWGTIARDHAATLRGVDQALRADLDRGCARERFLHRRSNRLPGANHFNILTRKYEGVMVNLLNSVAAVCMSSVALLGGCLSEEYNESEIENELSGSIHVPWRQFMLQAFQPQGIRAAACGEDYYVDFIFPFADLSKIRVTSTSIGPTNLHIVQNNGLDGIYHCHLGWCQLSLCSTSKRLAQPESLRICFERPVASNLPACS
jgi:hypothetical protein